MQKPVILAVDHDPRVLRWSGDPPIEYAVHDRIPPAGADGSSLDIRDTFSARLVHPSGLRSRSRVARGAPVRQKDRSLEVADNDPAETSRVQIRESKIEKGRFA